MRRDPVLVLLTLTLFIAALALFYGLSWSGGGGKVLRLYLGSAAQKPWEEVIAEFEERYGVEVVAEYGGSGSILSKLMVARKGDIFAPGSQNYMMKALKAGVIDESTVRIVAYLIPAIIVSKGNPKNITSLRDLARPGLRVGIADPKSVCVGEYAKDLLEYNGLWEDVKGNIMVYAESCAKTAILPVMGSVDAIIGWHVFHYWYPNETEIIWLKPHEIPRIAYIPIAATSFAEDRELALRFIDFTVNSSFAKSVFQRYHYFSTEEEARRYAPEAEVPGYGP